MGNKFAIFILTYGRPERVYTYNTLRKQGYSGNIYLITDDSDKTIDQYKQKYKNQVIVFNKEKYLNLFDIGDNFNDTKTVTFARNACFDIAEKLGIEYFFEFDDDYTAFNYKQDNNLIYCEKKIKNIDRVLNAMIEWYKKIPALSIAMAQGGDFIGGKMSGFANDLKPKRKCMNTFLLSTKRRFDFISRMNDDVTTYTRLGEMGKIFFTIPMLEVKQKATQANKGGLTDMYLDFGTYVKSFYTVMFCPSSCKIGIMGDKHKRIHHKINWNNAVPLILNESYRKTVIEQ